LILNCIDLSQSIKSSQITGINFSSNSQDFKGARIRNSKVQISHGGTVGSTNLAKILGSLSQSFGIKSDSLHKG